MNREDDEICANCLWANTGITSDVYYCALSEEKRDDEKNWDDKCDKGKFKRNPVIFAGL